MKQIFTFTIVLFALTACTSFRVQTSESTGTNNPQVGMPNPATVFCEQGGNKHEIQTASDGSQSGVCIFPNGSTCDEWAYFRGECAPAASGSGPGGSGSAVGDGSGGSMPTGATEEINDWRGVIKSTEPGTEYDDYFELWINDQVIYFGIDSTDPAIQAQIVELRDSDKIIHLYGTLVSNVPDYNGSQIRVDRIEIEQ